MMKKVFSFLTILAILLASNCSRIEENNDPVIGIWANATTLKIQNSNKQTENRQEWIFNDVYLGRYHNIENGVIVMKTDFKWSIHDGVYTISYPGLPGKENDLMVINSNTDEQVILQDINGNLIALRE